MNEEKLFAFASRAFGSSLQPAERRLLLHSASATDPPILRTDVPEYVRSDFVRWLLTDQRSLRYLDPRGFRIWLAHIKEPLDLDACKVGAPVGFAKCVFDDEIRLSSSQAASLTFAYVNLKRGIQAPYFKATGSVIFGDCRVAGAIDFRGAVIGDEIGFRNTTLAGQKSALILDNANIRNIFGIEPNFWSEGGVWLRNADIGGDLNGVGAVIAAGSSMKMDGLRVRGSIFLNHLRASGPIRLLGAQVTGSLSLIEAEFAERDVAVKMDRAEINGSVFLNGAHSLGRLELFDTKVGSNLELKGGSFYSTPDSVLLNGVSVSSGCHLSDDFNAAGTVNLAFSRIGGELRLETATVGELYAPRLQVGKELWWIGIKNPQEAKLNLDGATIGALWDDKESWPAIGRLSMQGAHIESLVLHALVRDEAGNITGMRQLPLRVDDRATWLKLQHAEAKADPLLWLSLAKLLEAQRNKGAANRLIFEFRRLQSQRFSHLRRLLSYATAWLERDPLLIAVPIVMLTLFGSLVFSSLERKMGPTNETAHKAWASGQPNDLAYPRFSPIAYSLENVLPVIKLGQDEKWAPDERVCSRRIYWFLTSVRWFLILFGWAQATVLVAALGERFRR